MYQSNTHTHHTLIHNHTTTQTLHKISTPIQKEHPPGKGVLFTCNFPKSTKYHNNCSFPPFSSFAFSAAQPPTACGAKTFASITHLHTYTPTHIFKPTSMMLSRRRDATTPMEAKVSEWNELIIWTPHTQYFSPFLFNTKNTHKHSCILSHTWYDTPQTVILLWLLN